MTNEPTVIRLSIDTPIVIEITNTMDFNFSCEQTEPGKLLVTLRPVLRKSKPPISAPEVLSDGTIAGHQNCTPDECRD